MESTSHQGHPGHANSQFVWVGGWHPWHPQHRKNHPLLPLHSLEMYTELPETSSRAANPKTSVGSSVFSEVS
jgi:hypothetical protein